MTKVKETCNDLEQYSRRECVEIHGIPPTQDDESTEDTNEIVCKIGELIGFEIESQDISVSHRLPTKGNWAPAIIAKFVRRETKEDFYGNRKKLRSFTTKDLGYGIENKIKSLTTKV